MFKDLLTLSRREQRGFMVLVVLLLMSLLLRIGLPYLYEPVDFSELLNDSIEHYWHSSDSSLLVSDFNKIQWSRFNPNNVDVNQLKSFGLNQQTASNWIKYIEAGGHFHSAQDIRKIYGVADQWFFAALPYIDIVENNDSVSFNFENNKSHIFIDLNIVDSVRLYSLEWTKEMIDSVLHWKNSLWFSKRYLLDDMVHWDMYDLMLVHKTMEPKYPRKGMFDVKKLFINEADTSEWALLKGVGPVLSGRIVRYRKALGGFVSISQISEVYGISPIIFKDIEPFLLLDSIDVKTIDVNTASLRKLRSHPYIDFYMAKEIVERRKQNGKFTSVQELEKMDVFDDELWQKLKFYLVAEIQ